MAGFGRGGKSRGAGAPSRLGTVPVLPLASAWRRGFQASMGVLRPPLAGRQPLPKARQPLTDSHRRLKNDPQPLKDIHQRLKNSPQPLKNIHQRLKNSQQPLPKARQRLMNSRMRAITLR
jgi:hypothetical protein